MEPIVRSVLPMITWTLEKVFGPVFKPNEWQAMALSLVPPPDNAVNAIMREFAEFNTPALLASSRRRRIRNLFKRCIRHQFRDNQFRSLALAVRQYLLKWRQELEAKGYNSDPARIRKMRDIEAEIDDRYYHLLQSGSLPEALKPIVRRDGPDVVNLLWEFAAYGEGGTKPKLRQNSVVWAILGIDPKQLQAMPPQEGFLWYISRSFQALLRLSDNPLNEASLGKLLRWVVRTHLPSEREPETTPGVLSKAVEAGLIHKGIVTRDKETGEVAGIDVEDPNATDFIRKAEIGGNEISGAEDRETITQAFALKGIGYNDLTPGEWAEIFERYDLIREGYEFSSKTGISISSYYGAAANTKEQRWSRIRKKIRDVINR